MNFTVTVVEDALWSGLEITLGIINACLPVIQPAVRRIVDIPFVRLISFSSIRSSKNSKLSEGSGTTSYSSQFPSWVRLGNLNGQSKTYIERQMEYTVDIESESGHHMSMEKMDSATKLSTGTS
jgi:hypothetical protein